MLKIVKRKPRSLLGMDINPSVVNIVELSYSGDQYSIAGYGSMPLPAGAIAGGLIDIDTVSACIKKILLNTHFNSKAVALAIPNA